MYDGAGRSIRPKMIEIKTVVARHNGVTVADLECACRKQAFAWPRQIAQYLCREMTTRSYPEIARMFGGRDHTTVIFAHRKVARLLAAKHPELAATLDAYRREIHEAAAKRAEAGSATRLTPAAPINGGATSPWTPTPPRQTKGQKLAAIIDAAAWMQLGGEMEAAS